MATEGIVYNIQPFSIQDGPGIRTVVFFKGCHLRCAWCHNPESIRFSAELQFNVDKCILCGSCFQVCPNLVHEMVDDEHVIHREECTACGECVKYCFAEALKLTGTKITPEALWQKVRHDVPYYNKSGGGVTVSGGECIHQPGFLKDFLMLLKKQGVHTAVDTAGFTSFDIIESILPYTDLFLFDIKAMSSALHNKLTKVDNKVILENLKKILALKHPIIIRIPAVPNGNWEEIPQIAKEIADYPNMAEVPIELLPYHKLGEGKHKTLGQEGAVFETPSNQEMDKLVAIFKEYNLHATYTKQ